MSESIRTYTDLISGIKPFPKEWWRVNFLIEECIKDKHYAAAYDILMMWRKTNIVSSASYSALISICRATLDEIEQIDDLKNSKAKEFMKLLEAEEFQYLFKDGQRAINLAEGSKKIHVSGLLDYIKSKYKKLIDSVDDFGTVSKVKGECEIEVKEESAVSKDNTYSGFKGKLKSIQKKNDSNGICNQNSNSDELHLNSKAEIQNKFENILRGHTEVLLRLRSLNFKHDSLKQIKEEFVTSLEDLIRNIHREYKIVKDEIVWDHLVIGFFGETNAGKSTIIETIRLRYSKDNEGWNHGEIVGTGEADFTKEASEYELIVNGKRVTLIDIPGIEGDESKYSHIISKALRKAHYVFYVHKKNSRPDTKIASRIQQYLSDWTRVCSIYNVSNSIGNYDEAEDRVNLYTEGVKKQSDVIKSAFIEMLGKLYEENITLQAQVALCASSNFSNSVKLANDANKLHKYFKDSDTAYSFSRFGNLIGLLDELNSRFDKVIIDSQNQKLKALKKRSRSKLEEFEKDHSDFLHDLQNRLRKMDSDVNNKVQSSKNVIKHRCEAIIDSSFNRIELQICEAIDNNKNDIDGLVSKIQSIISSNEAQMYNELRQDIRSVVSDMTKGVSNRVAEIKNIHIPVPKIQIDLYFESWIDIDYITDNLQVSFGDVLDVVGGMAGGARKAHNAVLFRYVSFAPVVPL